ncbi:MAG: precorrin-4 C(11)-methyltransferase [Bacteroidales bacterium]|nr:precorrin-4 C(11)-methyltransferase [Bacteroidales bacterium]
MDAVLQENKISRLSVCSLSTVTLKKDEQAFIKLAQKWNVPLECYDEETLAQYDVPNPSEKVNQVTGTYSVCEASAMHSSGNGLLAGKIKRKAEEHFFTVAIAFNRTNERKGYVEFVGAGPGDPELVSVRGKRLLQTADYILYAGSLVPKELTHYAKPGCVVESSASMDLETQLASMKAYYNQGLLVVRLHTGDPCIYGAIQEQMAIMDEWGWNYSITPGISSFQAAAAALRSQFTIPEEVQTIILTRGEGRTPMPEREQLHKLAQSQSTMCIYLSASIAPKIQDELLVHYPSDTPVAICYKLTWKDERIYRCILKELAQTVEENKLSMTTLIVVGKAIDNRHGVSKLYNHGFEHAFRKENKKMILVFGGTTEGKEVAELLDFLNEPYYYSTKTKVSTEVKGKRISGTMEQEQMIAFCKYNAIRLIIDAAHPFAIQLHENIFHASVTTEIPVIRFERNYPAISASPLIRIFSSFPEMVEALQNSSFQNILALTGVQTIPWFKSLKPPIHCYFRILDSEQSIQMARSFGVRDNFIVPAQPTAMIMS